MKSTMKFFKKAKLHENTAERDQQMKEMVKVRFHASSSSLAIPIHDLTDKIIFSSKNIANGR